MERIGDVISYEPAPDEAQLLPGKGSRKVWTRLSLLARLKTLKKWMREPLTHFLLIGLLLFVVYGALNPGPVQRGTRIELTADDIRQLEISFVSKWGRPPAPQEFVGLVDSRVREEILYREALALGLDNEDTIVKRRLAQKMEFLAEDLSDLREPATEEYRAWFAKNSQRFALPPRVTFRHLYFSPDKRGQRAREAAEHALTTLAGKPSDAMEAAGLADPFMFQNYFGDRSKEQVAKDFGPNFAQSLFRMSPGSWQGPVESGYGWHLVWIDSITPGRVPQFEEVEPDVKSEWVAERRAEFKRKAYEAMKARYEIVLPDTFAKYAPPGAAPAPR